MGKPIEVEEEFNMEEFSVEERISSVTSFTEEVDKFAVEIDLSLSLNMSPEVMAEASAVIDNKNNAISDGVECCAEIIYLTSAVVQLEKPIEAIIKDGKGGTFKLIFEKI